MIKDINYDFILHFMKLEDINDAIIKFKNKDNNIRLLINNIKNEYSLKDDDYYEYIRNILESSLYNYINEGIYSDRELVKNNNIFSFNKDILLNYRIDNILDLDQIFSIDNKFFFFYKYFKWHTKYIKSLGWTIKNNNLNKNIAVIVEMRNHILLEDIIYNVMYNLGDGWNLHIFCGYNNISYIKKKFNNINISILPFYNLSVNLYDYIFMNKFFWESISEENILIFQIDSFLIDNPTYILLKNNYPYIGSLHTNVHNNVSYLTPKKVGFNGGLSFRKKSYMINIIEKISVKDINKYRQQYNIKSIVNTSINKIDLDFNIYKYYNDNNNNNILYFNELETTKDLIYEDVYFSHGIEILNYNIPNNFISKYLFIQEDLNGYVNNIYGVHGWDKNYLEFNYLKNILKKYTIKLLSNNIDVSTQINDIITNYNLLDNISEVKILIVIHNMKGGTEKYMQDILNINMKNNKITYDIIRLLECNLDSTTISLNNNIIRLSYNLLLDKKYEIIHIHYINEPAGILVRYIDEYIDKSIYFRKLIITLHDYHLIDHTSTNDYHLTIFNSCYDYLDKMRENKIKSNLYYMYKNLILKANLVLTGSFVCKFLYNYYYNLPYNLIKVIPHPEKKYFEPIIKDYRELNYDYLNIGVIGAINITKGSYIIQSISNIIKNNNIKCKIYHFGLGFNKNIKDKSNIEFIGSYSSEDELHHNLIKYNINLLWFPAFRHETYCYTLTLAMQSNLPILAYDSGTFRERLSTYKSPFKIHNNIYNVDILYNDILIFWGELKEKNYNNTNNYNYNYDSIEYNNIYMI